MAKRKQPLRYHLTEIGGYRLPCGNEAPMPNTAETVRIEVNGMADALNILQIDIANPHGIQPGWGAYRALCDYLRRWNSWFPQWQFAIRLGHKPTIPTYMGKSIVSYHETLRELGGMRIHWLRECIAHVPIDTTLHLHDQWLAEANALHADAKYLREHWKFPELDIASLKAGLEIEQTWATAETGPHLTGSRNDIRDVIAESNRRLTTAEISDSLANNGTPIDTTTLKTTLSTMVDCGILTQGSGARGKGYGLPQWCD